MKFHDLDQYNSAHMKCDRLLQVRIIKTAPRSVVLQYSFGEVVTTYLYKFVMSFSMSMTFYEILRYIKLHFMLGIMGRVLLQFEYSSYGKILHWPQNNSKFWAWSVFPDCASTFFNLSTKSIMLNKAHLLLALKTKKYVPENAPMFFILWKNRW